MLDSLSQKVPYIGGPRGEVEENGGDPSKGSVGRGIPCRGGVLSSSLAVWDKDRQLISKTIVWACNRHHVTSDNVHMCLHMEIM